MTAGFTFVSLGTALTASAAAVVRGVMNATVTLFKALTLIPGAVRAYLNRGQVLRLLDMDDRMLRDIGLTRGDVTASLSGSLANDPSTRLRILAVERRAGARAQAREQLAELQSIQARERAVKPVAAKLTIGAE